MTTSDIRPRSIDIRTLRKWQDEAARVRVLDVRTPAEFEQGHVPGAVNIPLTQLGKVCTEISRRQPGRVVVMCQAGPRSERAQSMLAENGCAQAYVLDGGMNAWGAQGGEVEQGKPLWSLERQVRLAAGSLVLGGVLASLRFPQLRFLSGAVGGGLVYAAVSNTCAMGNVLSRLPYNHRSQQDLEQAVEHMTAA